MKKFIPFLVLYIIGAIFFYINASSSFMDESGVVHEPFFFLVPLAYLSFALGILDLVASGVITLARRLRAKRTPDE